MGNLLVQGNDLTAPVQPRGGIDMVHHKQRTIRVFGKLWGNKTIHSPTFTTPLLRLLSLLLSHGLENFTPKKTESVGRQVFSTAFSTYSIPLPWKFS
jgi:hypothetical protein